MIDARTIPTMGQDYRKPDVSTFRWGDSQVTFEDITLFRRMAGRFTTQQIADTLGWPVPTVRSRARKLGLSLVNNAPRSNAWETWRDEYLIKHYLVISYTEIAGNLGMNYNTVRARAMKLGLAVGAGLRPNSTIRREHVEFIIANHMTMTYRQMADELGMTWEQVRGQVRKLGLTHEESKRQKTMERIDQIITDEVIPLLRAGYSIPQAADRTGVSTPSIYRRLPKSERQKLTKKRLYKPWTTGPNGDETYLIENYGKLPIKTIAAHLKRTEGSIFSKIRKLGIRHNTEADHELKADVLAAVEQGLEPREIIERYKDRGLTKYFFKKWTSTNS